VTVVAVGLALLVAPAARAVSPSAVVPYYPVFDAGPRSTAINEPMGRMQVSQDGEFVAFATQSRLVADDTDDRADVYLRDNATGSYERISAPIDGVSTPSDIDSTDFVMSSDSTQIAFIGNRSHLGGCFGCLYLRNRGLNSTVALTDVPVRSFGMDIAAITIAYNPATGPSGVYVRSLLDNSVQQLVLPSQVPPDPVVFNFNVSIGGGAIAFPVNAVLNGQANNRILVYRLNGAGGYDPVNLGGSVLGAADVTADLQDPGPLNGGGSSGSDRPMLSGDGRYLTFESEFTDLTSSPDTNGQTDVFFRDLGVSGFPLRRISLLNNGDEVPGSFADEATIDPDGRFVAFEVGDGNVPGAQGWFGPSCDCGYIMLWDRDAGEGSHLSLGSHTWDGRPDNTYPVNPTLSVAARFLAYSTGMPDATTTPDADGGHYDMVMWDRSASFVDVPAAAPGALVRSQGALDATNPVGMQISVPTGGHVLITKSRKRWQPSPSAVPVDATFQSLIPPQSASAPARATFGVDASIHPPGIDQQRLTVRVDGVELPACPSPTTMPPDTVACQEPLVVTSTERSIDVLTLGSLGNEVDLVWGRTAVDHTPPTVAGTPDRAPDSNGWYNHNVTITWSAVDPAPSSGTPSTPAPTTASTEGQSVTYTSGLSCDPAHNCGTGSLQLSLDKTAPTVTITTPASNASYTYGTALTADDTCADALSHVQSCTASSLDLSPGTHAFSVTARDVAGNQTVASVNYTIVDGSASQTVSAGGTVSTDPSGQGATPQSPLQTAVTTSTGGTVSIATQSQVTQGTPSIYDIIGEQVQVDAPPGSATAPLTLTFIVDASKLGPQEDGSVLDANNLVVMRNGVPITTGCDGSGQASPADPCVLSRNTNTDGDAIVTVLSSHASTWNLGWHKPYRTASQFFGSPVSNTTRNYAKAGTVVGFKFGLTGYQGLDIFAANSPSSVTVTSCAAPPGKFTVLQGSNASSPTLTYEKRSDLYTYNWRTSTGWINTCRTFTMTLSDGTRHTASFYFVK
jgi:hypothetical protein